MTDLSKAELKKRWGTMQKVVSAEPRAKQIVNDILLDMETKPRLMDGRGNAMLVGVEHLPGLQVLRAVLPGRLQGQVRHRHQLRAAGRATSPRRTPARARPRSCASTRSTGRCWPTTSTSPPTPPMDKVEQFEKEVKEQFVNEPGQMRLLIVVDKLLTGFDAPRATYLYIDKKMQDHGLFQAICRVNRLDGDDKDYGYIVDYQTSSTRSRAPSPTTPAARSTATRRRTSRVCCPTASSKAREDLDEALERIRALCEPVAPPKNTLQYQQYFCAAEQGNAEQLKANEPKRVELYKAVARRDPRLRQPRQRDGRPPGTATPKPPRSRHEIAHYASVRDEVKLGAGEDVDFKQYEAGMRFLLDTYIQADAVRGRRRLRGRRPDPAHRPAGRRGDRQAAEGHQDRPRGRRRDDHQQHAQGDHRRATR